MRVCMRPLCLPVCLLLRPIGLKDTLAHTSQSQCNNDKQVDRAKALGVTQKRVNLEEMAAFQKGKKLVAIISEAGECVGIRVVVAMAACC